VKCKEKNETKTQNKQNKDGKKLRVVLTVIFLVLSAAAIGAKIYLVKQRENQKSQMIVPEAVIVQENRDDEASSGLSVGANIIQDPTVLVTQGTAFLRFNVELQDSDGTPFYQKLQDKQQEIEDFQNELNPDSPSYISFVERYHSMLNEYNLLYAKGLLVYETLYRDLDYVYVGKSDNPSELTPNLPTSQKFSTFRLENLLTDGKIEALSDEDGESGSDFTRISDDENPFSCRFVYNKKLSAGESCTLFTNVVVPTDWEQTETEVTIYTENEDNTFSVATQGVNNMEIIGDGFIVKISAEIVDASDYKSAIQAFAATEYTSAVTELSSSEAD
jgi:flagellar basal body-associated protein FliL